MRRVLSLWLCHWPTDLLHRRRGSAGPADGRSRFRETMARTLDPTLDCSLIQK